MPVSVRVVLDVLHGSLLELMQQLIRPLAAHDHSVLEQTRGSEACEHRLVGRDRIEDLLCALLSLYQDFYFLRLRFLFLFFFYFSSHALDFSHVFQLSAN